jgi:hypothetical protein
VHLGVLESADEDGGKNIIATKTPKHKITSNLFVISLWQKRQFFA